MTTKVAGQMTRGVAISRGSVSEIKALKPFNGAQVILSSFPSGIFSWSSGDFTSLIDGINYIEWSGDSSPGASGAWVRNKGSVTGNYGKQYNVIGFAMRRDTNISTDWQVISDTAHLPINFDSITSATETIINYDGDNIGTLVAAPDERFASGGVMAGGSVSADSANLRMGAPCSFVLDLDAETFDIDERLFGQSRFGVSVSAAGLVTVSHPQLQTNVNAVCHHLGNNSTASPLYVKNLSSSGGTSTFYLIGDLSCQIYYNGTLGDFTSRTRPTHLDVNDLSFSWNGGAGELTVTHPICTTGAIPVVSMANDGGAIVYPVVVSSSATDFVVKFYDTTDTVITTLSEDLLFNVSRGETMLVPTPRGKVHLHLGHVQVDMNQVDWEFANLWIYGIMGRES